MNLVLSPVFHKINNTTYVPIKYIDTNPLFKKENYGLIPKQNSWEEYIMLLSILSQISRAIKMEEQKKKRLKRKRKRSNSDSSDSTDNDNSIDDDFEEREIKRLKLIEKKLKRKYQEMLYG